MDLADRTCSCGDRRCCVQSCKRLTRSRVWFKDQFSNEVRSSGFILRADDLRGVDGFPLYWEPDYEEDA
jgi:hypothetical protein